MCNSRHPGPRRECLGGPTGVATPPFPVNQLHPLHPLQTPDEFREKNDSFARGVEKVKKPIPTLHGKQNFFSLPCSMGSQFPVFPTPLQPKWPPAEGRFAAEGSSKSKMAFPCCMGSPKKVAPMQRGNRFFEFDHPSAAKRSFSRGG